MLKAALWLLAISLQCAAQDDLPTKQIYVKYIIVGAGPGGLQMAHYLHSAGRDYAVLEGASDNHCSVVGL
jgi:ribulose 1,5-bisphosphate synthetase/thiazole synthase